MEFLQSLLDNSNLPVLTAFILGLLTAVSPCPLATNITAIGFISKDIQSRNRIFWSGILYTLGRVISYTILGFILIPILREGASMFAIQKAISKYGDVFIAPALILIGLFMLLGNRLNLPKFGFSAGDKTQTLKGIWGSLLLGALFALAFCPTSGVFYFGMLMPMAAAETGGYLLPIVFALATGLPVIVVAWILAYSIAGLGKFYNRIQVFQKWFNRVVAVLFIVVGIYYAIVNYL
ncbi:aromatic aminobenezylarsenical efflux permease ArsG family transporter [uncultured Bacteroides sp.]|uniref:aromatic aminobenezylarsenical efflux permease ArsG family transporter n=1 Tax=uncultured Bacteroides sp. TaxID=162156 RepID=UPI00280AEF5C|nr:aromatic aminobenezylarsenical efflux permease ArsG family transporter [uncultured Bacteroides sp.]